jgi:hypothetical protein
VDRQSVPGAIVAVFMSKANQTTGNFVCKKGIYQFGRGWLIAGNGFIRKTALLFLKKKKQKDSC